MVVVVVMLLVVLLLVVVVLMAVLCYHGYTSRGAREFSKVSSTLERVSLSYMIIWVVISSTDYNPVIEVIKWNGRTITNDNYEHFFIDCYVLM